MQRNSGVDGKLIVVILFFRFIKCSAMDFQNLTSAGFYPCKLKLIILEKYKPISQNTQAHQNTKEFISQRRLVHNYVS
jgi:hypothetical protein